jgi:2-oxoglutarate dehydrogenase E2 component (dihydrolipoamide succinyltransferase)
MPTPIVMPQMGESITEGTIVRWIKQVGDTVDRDEPLFEISTDKVDAEIPSPAGASSPRSAWPRARPCPSTRWWA